MNVSLYVLRRFLYDALLVMIDLIVDVDLSSLHFFISAKQSDVFYASKHQRIMETDFSHNDQLQI